MTLQALTHSVRKRKRKKKRPPMLKFRIVPYGTRAYLETVVLREEVLRKPLGMKFHGKDLVAEKDHWHLSLWDANECIATVVLQPLNEQEVKLRQMAVKEEYRGNGVGSALIALAERLARNEGFETIVLHARQNALDFYKQNGYEPFGKTFTEVGIPHKKMQKSLV